MNAGLCGVFRIVSPNITRINLSTNHVKCSLYCTFYLNRHCYHYEIVQRQKQSNRNISKLIKTISTSTRFFAAITVKAPVFPESVADGDLRWKKKAGDPVNTDEVIAEIETDKVALPVSAPRAGTIKELIAQEGAVIKSEAPLCTIDAK